MEGIEGMKGMKDIVIYTTPTCAPCRMVQKLYDHKKVEYTKLEASGEDYEALAKIYGSNVPLVYNFATKEGTTGYHITKLLKVAGL